MGKNNWITWSVFFALLVNIASASDLRPASTLHAQGAVCDAQAAIAHALNAFPRYASVPNVLQIQQMVDFAPATSGAEGEELSPPLLATHAIQRNLELPAVVAFHAPSWLEAYPIEQAAEPSLFEAGSESRSGPPENRYRFLLTPNAPPAHV